MDLTTEEKKIFQNLIKLGCSEEEATETILSDRKINKGEKLFELPDELKAGAKKARRADRKPNSMPTHRERKADEDKREIISIIEKTLKANCSEIEIENAERVINFNFHNRKFKITLSAPRT